MAHRRRHHRHHRHNPLGVSGGVVKEVLYLGAGAFGASALPNMVAPQYSKGWSGVVGTGISAVALSYIARMLRMDGPEVLKGGLLATAFKAAHELGFKALGLGLYAPSWFGVPTSSSQYLQASQANLGPYRRGAGTIFFPGPGGALVPAAPTVAGMGYHRFRSRYAGGYG